MKKKVVKNKKDGVVILIGGLVLSLSAYLLIKLKVDKTPEETQCKHPTYTASSGIKDFVENDCTFRAYPGLQIKELDEGSCRKISKYIIVDNNRVYKQKYDPGSSDYSEYIVVKGADPDTFISLGNGYYKDTNRLYYDIGESLADIRNVDLRTVEVLSTRYLKDRTAIYYRGDNTGKLIKLEGFDVNTFEVVQNYANHDQYFRDSDGIYFEAGSTPIHKVKSKIVGADIETFQVLNDYQVAKDKNHVYVMNNVTGADSVSFEVLAPYHYKDKDNVYTGSYKGLYSYFGIDACTYELIGYTSPVEWQGYSRDKNYIYYGNISIDGADLDTFKVENGSAFDKNYEYEGRFRVQK